MRKLYYCPLFTGILLFLSGNILPAQPPEITGQNTVPAIDEDTFIDIDINHLNVVDDTPGFPTGFTLIVEEGSNYTFENTRVTPALNFNGQLDVRVRVTDPGMETSGPFDFRVDVTAVNDLPVIEDQVNSNAEIQEESTHTIAATDLVITDPDVGDIHTVTIASGSNYTASGDALTPDPDYFGPLQVGVTVNDGTGDSNEFTYNLLVTNVNDAPTMNGIAALSLNAGETAEAQLTGIFSGADNEDDELEITIENNTNTDLFSQTTINYVSPNSEGSITFEALPGVSGTADITARLSDGAASVDQTFTVTVEQLANASPTLDAIADADIDEDAMEQVVDLEGISPGAGEEGTQTVTVEAESNMPSVIPNPTIVHDGTSATGTLRYQPLPDQFTTGGPPAVITVRVRDSEDPPLETTRTFNVLVNSVNDLPVIEEQVEMDVQIPEDETHTIAASDLVITDPDVGDTHTVTIAPGSNYTASGDALTPDSDYFGPLQVGITVNDGTGDSNEFTYNLSVTNVNDAPTMNGIAALSLNAGETADAQLTGIFSGADNEDDELEITIENNTNTDLFSQTTINYVSPNSEGSITFEAKPGVSGTADITARLSDGAASVDQTFTVTVEQLANASPTLDAIADADIDEDAMEQVVDLEGISPGAGEEGTQTVTVEAESNMPSVIPNPTIVHDGTSATGTLRYQPLPDQFTTGGPPVVITVRVRDGEDPPLEITRTFNVVVNSVNDPPTLNDILPVSLMEGGPAGDALLSGITSGAANENDVLEVSVENNTNTALFSSVTTNYTSPNQDGSITFTPAPGMSGNADITVRVSDGGAFVEKTFTVSVQDVNAPPSMQAIDDAEIDEDAPEQTVELDGITPGPGEETIQTVTLEAESSLPSVIPTPSISYGGGPTGQLRYQPLANQFTTGGPPAIITVTLRDSQDPPAVATRSFNVVVNSVNDPPVISGQVNMNVQIQEESTHTIRPEDLIIIDPDDDTFTVAVAQGENYTASGADLTPVVHYFGPLLAGVTVDDGEATSNSHDYSLTVTNVNDPPTLGTIGDLDLQDGETGEVALTGISTGAPNENDALNVTIQSNSNPDLFADIMTNYASPQSEGSIAFTAANNASGSSNVTVRLSDGEDFVDQSFVVSVEDVNAVPTIDDNVADAVINEDDGVQVVNLTGITAGAGEEGQQVSVSATSSNPAIIPHPSISHDGFAETAQLTYQPVANQYTSGTPVTITVTVEDNEEPPSSNFIQFTVTVNPLNDEPTLDPLSPLNILEDDPQQTVDLTGISPGPNEGSQNVVVTATSDNTTLIPNPTVNYTPGGTDGSISFTPAPNRSGAAQITVTVTDNGTPQQSISQMFPVTVTEVNDKPTINPIGDVTVAENSIFPVIVNYTNVTDGSALELQELALSVTVTNDNPDLFLLVTNVYVPPLQTGLIQITPKPNVSGSATFTVTVSDGVDVETEQFVFTITSVNDPPSFDEFADDPITVNEDAGPQDVAITNVSPGPGETQNLTFSAVSSNPTLIPNPTVGYTQGTPTATLTFEPAANRSGTAVITVTVEDPDGANFSDDFTVEVQPINDAPTINTPGTLDINEDAAQQAIALTGITAGPQESQTLTVTASAANPGLFEILNVAYTSPNANATLNIKPAANQTGSTQVTITVTDDGPGTSPHVNTTQVNFTVNVNPENDPPVIVGQDEVSVDEDNNFTILVGHLTIEDPDNASGFTISVQPGANYTNSGTVITPAEDYYGDLSIPITVSDGTASSPVFNFQLTVNSVNDAPVITGQEAINIDEEEEFELTVDLLHIDDPDPEDPFPGAFTLTVLSGSQYSVTGTTIKPIPNFTGLLEVPVLVSDGDANSNIFTLDINVGDVNDPPVITGQAIALNINEDQSVVLALNQLNVTDPDNPPGDLSLIVQSGSNYTFSGLTVTPALDFNGPLQVSVVVSDGALNSAPFNMLVTVNPVNDAPEIVDQNPVTTTEDVPVTLSLADLVVDDPDDDDPYPDAFTMQAFPGSNYTLNGLTVTPALDFTGTLSVPVEVHDGTVNSNRFNLQIQVTDENDIPEINGQDPLPLVTAEDTPVTIELSHLDVTDTDNTYPDDFTIVIQSGTNYTYSGSTITPALDFTGTLMVTLRVNDGQNNSAAFPFEILVVGDNDPPTITGQKALSVAEDQTLEIKLTDLTVTDPDPEDVFPDDFTLTVLEGTNYTVEGTSIRPASNYFGPLSVPVRVSDGVNNSAPFNLVVQVTAVNDPPTIGEIADVTIPENTTDYVVQVTGISPGPLETQNLSFSVNSSNANLLDPTFTYNGTGSTATITLNPAPNQTGTVTLTVKVIDPGLLEATRTFTVRIEDINAAPTLDPIAFGPIPEDSPAQTIPLTGISAGPGENQALTLSATADKPELFETFTWSYTSPQSTGSLTVLPKPNAYGDVVITVTVTDDGSNEAPHVNFVTRQFTLEITPVPDAPVFISEPIELALIGEPYEYAIDVADGDPGAEITIEAAQGPGWLTLTQVSNGKATLSGTPPAGSSGSVLVSLKATDDEDSEVFQNFTLIVDARPVVSNFSITAEEDVAKAIEKLRFDAAFEDADNDFIETVKIVKLPEMGQLFVGTQAINEGQEISAGDLDNFTYKGLPDYNGRDTIVWNAFDGHAFAAEPARIFINVTPVNDPPVIVNLETDVLTVNAGEGPVQISTEFEVEDVDNEFLTGAEIRFRGTNFVAEDDLLVFEGTPKIMGSYEAESGILTLAGTATVAEYNAAIRSIRYDNVSSVFSTEEVIKTLSYSVSDGTVFSVPRDREIRLIDTFEELVIPNGFTPNSDGDNDLWLITNLERHVDASVRVYTIMGQIVYESDGLYNGWDGTYNGQLLPTDTYYYTIDLNLPFRKKVYKGAVTLLR